jgi:CMP-N-acetylneuraminic acid synthetase
MKKITAVIPVRKGSVRVRDKNIKPFANTTLLELKIKKLKNINLIDKIIVSSDCNKMLEIASKMGAQVHQREEYYASSEATNSEFFENLAETMDAEHIMYSPVTCPLISINTYRDCIQDYQLNEKIENLVTVSSVKHHLWLNNKPLNYKLTDSPNSQDLPDIYAISYGICILPRSKMLKYRNVVTKNPTFRILDEIESIDIDTEFDFMVAEHIYKKIYLTKQ